VVIRVLLADPHALVRTGVRAILEQAPGIEVQGEADSGRQALDIMRRVSPTVVLMEMSLGDCDGIQVMRELATLDVDTTVRVVVLTGVEDDEVMVEAFRAGARGYLLKGGSAGGLIHAIRLVAAGEELVAPPAARRLFDRLGSPVPAIAEPLGAKVGQLTMREVEVLQLMAYGRPNSEIAELLCLGETTIKSHVYHIVHKLDLRDRAQAVAFAYQTGLVRPRKRLSPRAAAGATEHDFTQLGDSL
jgi:DNA-binding NarL/FixJ family response regulator